MRYPACPQAVNSTSMQDYRTSFAVRYATVIRMWSKVDRRGGASPYRSD
jgi:hypothetical protein